MARTLIVLVPSKEISNTNEIETGTGQEYTLLSKHGSSGLESWPRKGILGLLHFEFSSQCLGSTPGFSSLTFVSGQTSSQGLKSVDIYWLPVMKNQEMQSHANTTCQFFGFLSLCLHWVWHGEESWVLVWGWRRPSLRALAFSFRSQLPR